MNLRPVIERELRTQARHPLTYWLRVIGGGLLVVMAWFYAEEAFLNGQQDGLLLFYRLQSSLYWIIWLFVPLLSADCISREKRQGTLGLLFLTPLKAWDIVLAKVIAQGLRGLLMCVAVFPILMLPLLMGGVSWRHVLLVIAINTGAFCLALTAGLLASTWSKWPLALVLGLFIGSGFHLVFASLNGLMLKFTVGAVTGDHWEILFWETAGEGVAFGMGRMLYDYTSASLQSNIETTWNVAELSILAFSILWSLLMLGLAAAKVRQSWQEKPASALRLWFESTFCQPMFFLGIFKRWMRHKMEVNPIGWLHQRKWSGRLVAWGWLAIMISFFSVGLQSLTYGRETFFSLQKLLGAGLILSISLNAAGSFQRERETGVLELLLISPLRVSQVIGGRLRGLWGQFLLALILMLAVWVFLLIDFRHMDWESAYQLPSLRSIWAYVCSYVTLPVIGLYFSLARRNFISSSAWTLLVGLGLPFLLAGVGVRLMGSYPGMVLQSQIAVAMGLAVDPFSISSSEITPYFLGTLAQIALALLLGKRLYVNLASRKFALVGRV